MMKSICLTLCAFVLLFIFCSTASAIDMSVFGFPLGQKFAVPECELIKMGEKYRYKILYKNVCFERYPTYTSAGETLGTEPIVNDTVKIEFPFEQRPDIAAGSYIRAVIIDGNLEGVFFYTGGVNVDDFVLAKLKEKYGAPTAFTPSKAQNRMGATFDIFTAAWTFDNLFVVFESTTERIDKGLVTINTKKAKEAEEKRQKELNKDKRTL